MRNDESPDRPEDTPDEALQDRTLGSLLQEAGARMQPPPALMHEVRAAAHAEWRNVVEARGRRQRQRVVGWAAAASVVLAMAAVWMGMRETLQPAVAMVAQVSHVYGTAEIMQGDTWQALSEQRTLHAGDRVQTRAGDRLVLNFSDNVAVRVDENTQFQLADNGLQLTHGAVYLDSGPDAPPSADALLIETPFGVVQHLGTQYEVRVSDDTARIRVREGRIQLTAGDGKHDAAAGEQLQIAAGSVGRERIALYGPEWDWVQLAAPAFDINNRTMAAFLEWVSRETGRQVVFDSPASQAAASEVLLHGSVAGLTPQLAMKAVAPTTRFRITEDAGRLIVALTD